MTLRTLSIFLLPALTLRAAPPPGEIERDIDHDGKDERIVNQPGKSEVLNADGKPSLYQLPDGLTFLDAQGRDTGLRLVDLNDDGFDDLILSNKERIGIHLWNKRVAPHLGWGPGWSRLAYSGKRGSATQEPPSLVEADVSALKGGAISVVTAKGVQKVQLKALMAFPMPPAPSPEEALHSFKVRPGFHVELAAAEPEVVDPVAFDWDAKGRLWVVEMRDYPLGMDGKGKPGGVVKRLTDTNHDGRWETAVVCAEGLPFPTGIFPWRDGVIVAAAPDILFLRDTNDDGKADEKRVLFTGFSEGNQQHRFNGFVWGLDGWLYAANGDSGGEVRCVATATGAAPVPQKPVNIRGRDFRFRPDTGEFETISGSTQYGLRRDDWGRWFGNNNPNWLWWVTTPEHYLKRNPKLAVASVIQMLAKDNRVFPVSAAMVRPNQPESYGHVTSGCSPEPYRDDLFGPEFSNSVFACEPVHNAVHREVVREEGFGLAGGRAADEREQEFLASSNNWFRPVFLKTGPDGALWIADMMRYILEHPEWIAAEDQERMDLRAGSDKGRIWRVVPDNAVKREMMDFTNLSNANTTGALDFANGWVRDTAHRLILEKPIHDFVPYLWRIANRNDESPSRVHALAVLDTLAERGVPGAVDAGLLRFGLRHSQPQVRCQALRNSERMAEKAPALLADICGLANDDSPAVRRQLAFTLGAWPGLTATATLTQMAARDGADPLMRTAILSSVAPESPLMQQLRGTEAKASKFSLPKLETAPSPDRAKVIAKYLGALTTLQGDAVKGKEKFTANCAICHRVKETGNATGPDLAMTVSKPDEWMLTAILDPNVAVEARYMMWVATPREGTPVAGIITAETANNLTLRSVDGQEHTILRGDLKETTPVQRSLMPEGLEAALQPQDVADILAWLRQKP